MAIREQWQRLTRLDRLIVAAVIGLVVALFVLVGQHEPATTVRVVRDGAVIFTAPLDEPGTFRFSGPLGETEMRIADGHAAIVSSPCPYKVCIGMGRIGRNGDIIACVPNHLLVQVFGSDEGKERRYDLLSR